MALEGKGKKEVLDTKEKKNAQEFKNYGFGVFSVTVGASLTCVLLRDGKTAEKECNDYVNENRLQPVVNKGSNFVILPLA